ncbi:MAG: murein biosynthesis integral membrane protein MurJ [Patescibacteria group bacterium]
MPIHKNSFSSGGQSLLSASVIIAFASLFSRLLGLFRDRLLASTFGAGDNLDIYYASFRLPDLIFNLLILGSLNSAFIPIFKDYLSKNKQAKAFITANNLLNLVIIILIIFSLILIIWAKPFMTLIAPGFSQEKIEQAAALTRIMVLSPLFFSLSAIMGGILNSYHRFVSYSLAPIIYNLGIICGIIFLVPRYGLIGLSLGVVIGAALNFLIQIPEIIQVGFRYQPILNLRDSGLKKITILMIPTTLSLAISQINLTVDNIIGSTLSSGSIAVFNFANNIQSLPIGIFSIPICTAAFPKLVEHIAQKKYSDFSQQIIRSAKQILYLTIPVSIFMYIFRAQIVRLLLGAGAFNWEDTISTLNTVGLFAIGLPFQAIIPLYLRSFYSLKNTTKPLYSTFFAMIFNIVFSLIFTHYYGVSGLALSFSITSIGHFLIINFLFQQSLPSFKLSLNSTLYKIIISSLISGITAYCLLRFFEPIFATNTFIGLFWQTLLSSIMSVVVYLGMSYLFHLEELYSLLQILKISNLFKKNK